MKNLGHDHVTTNDEFTKILINRFKRRDPEIYFIEVAHVKQTRNLEAYIYELQKLYFMLTDISESRLILFFIEIFVEPLKGLVKAYRPSTLQDALNMTRDL